MAGDALTSGRGPRSSLATSSGGHGLPCYRPRPSFPRLSGFVRARIGDSARNRPARFGPGPRRIRQMSLRHLPFPTEDRPVRERDCGFESAFLQVGAVGRRIFLSSMPPCAEPHRGCSQSATGSLASSLIELMHRGTSRMHADVHRCLKRLCLPRHAIPRRSRVLKRRLVMTAVFEMMRPAFLVSKTESNDMTNTVSIAGTTLELVERGLSAVDRDSLASLRPGSRVS